MSSSGRLRHRHDQHDAQQSQSHDNNNHNDDEESQIRRYYRKKDKSSFLEDDNDSKQHISHGVYRRNPVVMLRFLWRRLELLWLRWFPTIATTTTTMRGQPQRPLFLSPRGILGGVAALVLVVGVVVVSRILHTRQVRFDAEQRRRWLAPAPPDAQVSVVIMNHNRPRMLKESNLIPTLLRHPNIGEILLCHSNPKTKFNYTHPKLVNVDAIQLNADFGLSLRFRVAAERAQHPWIIHVDDDQELANEALDEVLAEFASDPRRIVGRYGREYRDTYFNKARHGYNTRTILGQVEVVLTKFLVMERRVCTYFGKYAYLVDDLLPNSKPLWNGEDIFMNLVANHVYGVPLNGPYRNYAFDLNIWEASDTLKDDDTGVSDVSGNMDRHRPWNVGWTAFQEARARAQAHTAYRGQLWATAKAKLDALPRPEEMLD